MESCRVYYKGEGGGFPQVRAVVSLVCLCCMWLVLAPKVLQLCINHFVWVLCRPVWVSKACQIFLVPSRSFGTPLYPSKCRELGSVPGLLLLPMFSYLGPHLGPLRSWECVALRLTTFKPCYCICMCCPHAFALLLFSCLIATFKVLIAHPPFVVLLPCYCLCTLLPCAFYVNRYSLPNFLCKWRSLELGATINV
jgi:hypothetical protein